jgi:hypothetical protein
MQNRRKTIETGIVVLFTITYGVLLIVFAKDAAVSVKNSITACLTVIIPSLYAYCVLSSFVISTGIYRVLSRPFAPIARYIFRIPQDFFSVFLLSCLAGYPVGAKMLSEAFNEGKMDAKTAADMQCYCFMGGPAYFCGAVSITLFGDIKPGLILFCIMFISNIICAFLIGLGNPIPEKSVTDMRTDITTAKFLAAVTDGGKSILAMCGIIVFFATFNCLLERLGFFTLLSHFITDIIHVTNADSETLLRSTVEINNILNLIPGNTRLLPGIAALLSFGGLCVITQVLQFSGRYINFGKFILYRLFSAALLTSG